jgi:hypothetical protein
MAVFSRNPHKHWVKPRLLKNKVAKSGKKNTAGRQSPAVVFFAVMQKRRDFKSENLL